MTNDPCFNCPLPDCDEESPRCALKRANAAYSQWKKRGQLAEMPPAVRQGHNAWYHAYKLERDARRSESGRA